MIGLCLALLFAQDVPPPLAVHRTAPPSQEELQKSIDALASGEQVPAAVAVQSAVSGTPQKAPRTYKPKTDVVLDDATKKALSMAHDYLDKPAVPVEGKDGRLRYTYGAGLPVIVTAPLHLTAIELQPGEIVKADQRADQQRWDVFPIMSGDQTMIIVRPLASGLDSNMLLVTDRRTYYLRLVSKPVDYMARVAFDYPESASADKWQEYEAKVADLKETHPPEISKSVEVVWTAGYQVHGKKSWFGREQHPNFWPTSVKDRDSSVHIELPDSIQRNRIPTLVRLGATGKQEPINYNIEGSTLITHTLFDRAVLVRGTGHKAEAVTIISPRMVK
jgi:type IV secretion system protein TrbG